MAEYDRIAGLSAQLSELGQHLAYRSQSSGGAKRESGEERAVPASARRSERPELVRDIERELAVLREARSFLAASLPPGDSRLRDLDKADDLLSVLRDSVDATTGPIDAGAIRRQVADSMRSAEGAINAATAIATSAGSNSLLVTRMATEQAFNARMSNIERTVDAMLHRDAQSFSQTEAAAERFGIDIGAYRAQRDALLREAEEKEKQGDHYGVITAKTLSVWNTYYTSQEVADAIDGEKYPAEKAAAQKRADEDRTRAERAEQEQRKAAEAKATRLADGMTFAGGDAERDAWIKAKADQDMNAYQDRKAGMRQPESLSEDQARSFGASMAALRRGADGAVSSSSSDVDVSDTRIGPDIEANYMRQLTGFAESKPEQYNHDAPKLPAAAQEAAKKAAAPVAQDTANAQAKDGEPVLPSSTPPVQVADAAAAKGSSVVI